MIDLTERLKQTRIQAKEREEIAKKLAQSRLDKLKQSCEFICDRLEYMLENGEVSSSSFDYNLNQRKAFLGTMEYHINMPYEFKMESYEKPFIKDDFLVYLQKYILNKVFFELKDVLEIQLKILDQSGYTFIYISITIQDNKEFFRRVNTKGIYPKWVAYIKKDYERILAFLLTPNPTRLEDHDDLKKASEEASSCVDKFIRFILDQFDLSSYLQIMSSDEWPHVSHLIIENLSYSKLAQILNANIDVDNTIILNRFVHRLLELTENKLNNAQSMVISCGYCDKDQLLDVYYMT